MVKAMLMIDYDHIADFIGNRWMDGKQWSQLQRAGQNADNKLAVYKH